MWLENRNQIPYLSTPLEEGLGEAFFLIAHYLSEIPAYAHTKIPELQKIHTTIPEVIDQVIIQR